MIRTRWFGPVLWTAFFFSGAAGLMYEVVWARYLNLILGGTGYAHVMVLAAYMGGMAAGAWFFGRLADRLRQPIAVYAYLEMAIGLYGLLFPLLFALGSALYVLLAQPLGTTGVFGVFNKLLISVLLLGPSTFLMGGTLPFLARAVAEVPDRVGVGVAGLYFINSAGAVVGTLAAGFFLVPALGHVGSLTVAAALNIVVGAALLGAWRYRVLVRPSVGAEAPAGVMAGQGSIPPPEPGRFPELPAGDPRVRLWALIAVWGAGVSGLIVMVYEVAWIRLLSTILGSSTYSFTLMLAAFISGIALGSLVARRLTRRGRPFLHFGLTQVAMGLALLITLPLYARLPFWFLELQNMAARTGGGYIFFEVSKYFFCLLLMLPPTLASGAALPLATDVAARLQHRIGAPVGRVYAVNTLGTIAGALLGGLILLPWLGVKLTIELGIVINLVFGVWVLSRHPAVGNRRAARLAVAAMVLLIVYRAAVPQWDQRALATGVFREHDPTVATRQHLMNRLAELDVAFYREDVNGTVAVLQQGAHYALVVNGKADASTFLNDRVTQTLAAAIPCMMHPWAKTALIIGLGSGQTAGHMLQYPLDRVEVVEISPAVVEASRFFDRINGRPLMDPRTRLITQDAKTYLLTRPQARYDLIVSEPSNPWVAGIGGLFSLEYFETLRDRLRPGGAAAQWIHVYEQSDETLESVLVTFAEVFPHVTLWGLSRADLLLVGTLEPPYWNFDQMWSLWERPGVSEGLRNINIQGLFPLLAQQILGPQRLREMISLGGRLNTDHYPYLEYQAPKTFFLDNEATFHQRFDERLRTRRHADLALAHYLEDRDPTTEELFTLVHYYRELGGRSPHLFGSAVAAAYRSAPDHPHAIEQALATGIVSQATMLEAAGHAARQHPENPALLHFYLRSLLEVYDMWRSVLFDAGEEADHLVQVLEQAIEGSDPAEAAYYRFRLGQILYDQGRGEEAVAAFEPVLDHLRMAGEPDPRYFPDEVYTYLGRVLLLLERFDDARDRFENAYRLNPRNRVAAYYIVQLHRRLGLTGQPSPR